MKQFLIWQKFLLIISLLLVSMGVLIALFNQTQFFNYIFNNQINPVFSLVDKITLNVVEFRSWIYGVLGATICGWGVVFVFIIQIPFKNRQKWAWNCLAASISFWFILDTTISLFYEVYFNAVFNSVLFVVIIYPLIFTKKYFNENIV